MSAVVDLVRREFALSEMEARILLSSACHRYKVYKIPKKRKGEFRTIAQPTSGVKELQRLLVRGPLAELPIHQCATAYVHGSSIKKNALAHLANRFLLKMDFRGFFPSIKSHHLKAHIKRHLPNTFGENDLELICRAIFWRPKRQETLILSIGGPASPFISNSIVFDFDALIAEYCTSREIIYTRYADDLTFSTNNPGTLTAVIDFVHTACNRIPYPDLVINSDKTVFTSKKHLRRVTGLVLASQGVLSLGRERKRLLRAKIHGARLGVLSGDELAHLQGELAFALDAEPAFVDRMRQKYGNTLIDQILRRRRA